MLNKYGNGGNDGNVCTIEYFDGECIYIGTVSPYHPYHGCHFVYL